MNTPAPQPPTPDDITDEMVGQFRDHMWDVHDMDIDDGDAAEALRAALTNPPARPEGAEKIDEPLRQANAAALGGALTPEQRRALADHLAAMHVRVVGEEQS